MPDTLIHMLSIKGFARPEVLAEAMGAAPAIVEEQLATLGNEHMVETTRLGVRLSKHGSELAAMNLIAQRERGDAAAIEEFYRAFDSINRDYKSALASWQMRDTPDGMQPNDHSDAAYDADVMTRMFACDAQLQTLLEDLADSWPLLADYARRLRCARARVDRGEQRYVAAPLIDSYHTVWFELHEALIRFCGRTRADEAVAGRAV